MLEALVIDKARSAEIGRNLLVWLALAGGAVALTGTGFAEAALVAGLGTIAVLSGLPVLLLAPVAGAALLDLDLVPWAIAGAALSHGAQARLIAPRLDSDLQRQLMRSRRRNEPAAVLVAQTDSLPKAAVDELLGTLRMTDGYELATHGRRHELRAVLEESGLDRGVVERRVREAAGPAPARLAWASFPEDGVTLEALVDHARGQLQADGEEAFAAAKVRRDGVATSLPSMAEAN